jgi:hypothetical protein
MALAHNPRIVTDGLVLCLDAANVKSYPGTGSTWYDISGNGYDATLSNVSHLAEEGAFDMNGSTSTIFASTFVPPRSAHTIMIYFKSDIALDNTTSSSNRLTLFKNGSQWNPGMWINGRVIRPHMPPEYRDKIFSYRPFTDWNMVGQIWNGSDLYTVDNGTVTLDTLRSSTYSQSNQTGMTIGYESGTTSYTLDGRVSVFQVYNRALTSNEVTQNFAALRGRYGI